MDDVTLMECPVVCGSCQVDGVSCCVDDVNLMECPVVCGSCQFDGVS